jgi:polar amino acid transport system ATP-binding protein
MDEAPQGEGPALAFDGVHKSFGKTKVLREFCLEIGRREHVSIIGPSGSGKTTVLRLAMALEHPEAGTVSILGEPLVSPNPNGRRLSRRDRDRSARARRAVGMVFQQFNLFPHMTVLQNITEAPRSVLGLGKDEASERAKRLLQLVGLPDKADQYPMQLSGGQQQRVAIARSLAMRPRVMLFDEITSALDPELVGEVLEVVRVLAEETDMTMLIATHEMRFAKEISDRIAMIDDGRVVEIGPPNEILEHPNEERTRRFLRAILEAG